MLTKNLRVCGHKVPLYPLFMVSGALCDVFQAFVDYLISTIYTFEWAKTTVCWTLSYTISIILRHSSHRLLVFGDYEGTYCMSLARTYMAYSTAIVISMFANHQLVAFFGLPHREAWVLTMLFTGIYNFFVLKASWRVINRTQGVSDAHGVTAPHASAKDGSGKSSLARDRSLSLSEGGMSSQPSGGAGHGHGHGHGHGTHKSVGGSGHRERAGSASVGSKISGGGGGTHGTLDGAIVSESTPSGSNRRRSSSMRVGFEADILLSSPGVGGNSNSDVSGGGGSGRDASPHVSLSQSAALGGAHRSFKEKDSMADLSSAGLGL
jgi:hypothetical protein